MIIYIEKNGGKFLELNNIVEDRRSRITDMELSKRMAKLARADRGTLGLFKTNGKITYDPNSR